MSRPEESPEDYQFEKLMNLAEAGRAGEHYARLLRKGSAIFDPLANFIIRQPNNARLAVLIELLGKLGDDRAVPLLMRFLEIPVPELKIAAATALGWLQAPAALEKLDDIEGNDPDPDVRHEARTAIEQILLLVPNLAHVLHHHSCMPKHGLEGQPGELEFRLIRALPRMIAFEFKCVPLAITDGSTLRVACRTGTPEEALAPLARIVGLELDATHWTADRIHDAQERLYTLGDDDFCEFHGELRPETKAELRRLILAGVRPEEPVCPLDEATDAVEAVQAFLSLCASNEDTRAIIEYRDGKSLSMRYIPGAQEHRLAAPPADLWRAFLAALRLACAIDLPRDVHHGLVTVPIPNAHTALSVEISGGAGLHSRRIEFLRTD